MSKFKNTRARKVMMEERENHMKFMLVILDLYKHEVDGEKRKFYMEHIKYYGELSAKLKDELDREDYSRYAYVERDYEREKEWEEFRKNPMAYLDKK